VGDVFAGKIQHKKECIMFKRNLTMIIAILLFAGAAACDSPAGKKTAGEVVDDAVITSTVKTAFLADSNVSGLNIDVDTNKGIVELKGTVGSEGESKKAEDIASRVNGVVAVENQLLVDTSQDK
jgi:hyperosmotically inducible protein